MDIFNSNFFFKHIHEYIIRPWASSMLFIC